MKNEYGWMGFVVAGFAAINLHVGYYAFALYCALVSIGVFLDGVGRYLKSDKE